ncbi:hypothetical protein BYT27DRAFT_7231726 [Phlegmacium glaucopus]|nr:hypothetical protein BYT27DRAFT_7231726 [Phlegmacium glaucopus]
MSQLNEDILRHIIPYLSLETLDRINAAHHVFFDAWMKARYESLTFVTSNERLLAHLVDRRVARYVKRVSIRPWLIRLPAIRLSLWVNIHEILDSDYIEKENQQRLRKCLQKDIDLVVSAFDAMRDIKEYDICWDENSGYHPELYKAFFTPILRKWTRHLVKLTIKVPPRFLGSLASVRLINLETLEYHICTGELPSGEIDHIHNGFLVFVNNLKDSLECISFVSTHTSRNLDITRIYRSLGPFPKLRSISLSCPFDGSHLSDPSVFVQFLEKHRYTLNSISLLTSRPTTHSTPGPEYINWIQDILTSVHSPFPGLRSLALALRPLKAPLTNVSNFLKMHMSTLDSLILADRALEFYEFAALMITHCSRFDLAGLRHLRIKLNNFCPDILYYLASEVPGLTRLDIECISIKSHRIDNTHGTDFEAFSREIIAKKHLLVNWELQSMAIGPPGHDWARYVERALVECMPNLMIANYTSRVDF